MKAGYAIFRLDYSIPNDQFDLLFPVGCSVHVRPKNFVPYFAVVDLKPGIFLLILSVEKPI